MRDWLLLERLAALRAREVARCTRAVVVAHQRRQRTQADAWAAADAVRAFGASAGSSPWTARAGRPVTASALGLEENRQKSRRPRAQAAARAEGLARERTRRARRSGRRVR